MGFTDGAGLTLGGRRAGRCLVCGEELGAETWWVTPGRLPDGEHTRCRDWSKHGFPSERHLTELRNLHRRVEAGTARETVRVAGEKLAQMAAQWPAGGADTVSAAADVVDRLKAELRALKVEPAVLNRL